MALSLLCGGLSVASASLEVVDQSGTAGTVTIYTKDEVDNALTAKGSATDVASNTTDITNLKNAVGDAGSGLTKEVADQKAAITANTTSIDTNKAAIESLRDDKLDKALANSTFATKDALNDLTTTVNGKADEAAVATALDGKANKADTLAGYGITDAYTKGDVDNKLNAKADAANVFTKDQTYTRDQVNTKLADYAKSADVYTKTDADAKFATSGALTTAKTELDQKIDNEIANRITSDTALDQKIDNEIANRITSDTALDQKIDKEIQDRENAIKDTNDRTGGIARNTEKTQTTIEGIVKVDNQGNVKDVKGLAAETITTSGNADLKGNVILGTNTANTVTVNGNADFNEAVNMDKGLTVTSGDTTLKGTKVDGKLTVTDETDLKNTKVDGTLGVTGATTLSGELTAEKNATFEKDVTVKGTTNLKDTTVDGDLKVTGTITTDKMIFGDKATNNYTEIDHGKVTSKNLVVNGAGETISSSSTFNAKENKVGFANSATGEQSSHKQTSDMIVDNVKNNITGDQSFHKQTSDVIMDNVKDLHNSNNRTQTKTETKDIITDKDGNSSTTSQTASENKTYLKDKDGKNTNSTIDTAKGYDKTIKGENGETSTKQDELNITNTAQKGTITNDAKDIVNNATGNLTTTVGGNELHEVTGTKTENVTGMVKENYSNGQETNVTGNQDIHVTGKQTNKIDGNQENTIGGNQTTTVTGNISNKATNITNEANKTLTDKVGEHTRVLDGDGITDTVGGSTFKQRIDAIMGNVKTADGESEVTQKGDEINSVVGKGEATTSRVTQKKGSIEAAVTDGTNTNDSYDVANASAKTLSGGTKVNKLQDNLDSSQKTITDGTYTTSKVQTALDITNTAADGTITNDAKNIVNTASGNMTNTVGGKLTTTVTGNISNKAANITNEATTKLTDKVGDHTRVLDGEGITDTVGGSTFKQRVDAIMMESKDVSIKAKETLTNEAKVITNKASEVINNEAVNINNKASGIINSKASEIKNHADKLISNKVGENTWENMEDGKISTSIKDGTKQNLTQSDAAGTTQSTVDGKKSSVTNQTASQITSAVADGAGNANASVADAKTSANTITNGTKANTVISTVDGTSFVNSEAAAPVTGGSGAGTAVNTTIKGNTITTGKVTMDYADVMKDLGVRGNAKVEKNLEVGGTSTLKGDVTMESNATVKKDLKVEGTTTTKTLNVKENATVGGTLEVTKKATFKDAVDITKNLSVGGNATITGDVTANSYKVGDKTYISADGINANNQKITNVADGSISEGSKDAVNGGQLYGVKRDLEHQVDKVGANAAAMANLRPMEFDPSSKWNIAAAIGNYGSETAAAIGAFYRPNDNVMVNLSTAFGTGENMVGGGVSVRLGKGGNKLSREETNALKAQVADLSARMGALLSVLNPNMSKDFPDVPENHWAYEAVSRLAGNDIVQGYPDGEFHGERTMTRYEMAEIIYNALSRGAEAERKLVEEFKPELQAMAASEKATAEKAEG